MIIELPWLNPKLSPNARVHWRDKARHIRKARNDAHMLTLEQMKGWERVVADAAETLPIKVTFHAPDRRKRDRQNMPASGSAKAYLDGIADALEIDDNKFQPSFVYGDLIKGGCVVVEVLG